MLGKIGARRCAGLARLGERCHRPASDRVSRTEGRPEAMNLNASGRDGGWTAHFRSWMAPSCSRGPAGPDRSVPAGFGPRR